MLTVLLMLKRSTFRYIKSVLLAGNESNMEIKSPDKKYEPDKLQ